MKKSEKQKFEDNLTTFAIIAIPAITLFVAFQKSPLEYTLSMIGNWFDVDERIKFLIWGITTAFLLTFLIYNLYKKTKFKNPKAYLSLFAAGLFLILSVITPTTTQNPIPKAMRNAFKIEAHGIFGILFAVFIIISLTIFSNYYSKKEKNKSIKARRMLLGVLGISILMLIIFGMTAIFEIIFFISLVIYILIIDKKESKKL